MHFYSAALAHNHAAVDTVPNGRTLETISIMEYVCEKTDRALLTEELIREREGVGGRHDGEDGSSEFHGLWTLHLGEPMADVIDGTGQAAPGCGNGTVPIR